MTARAVTRTMGDVFARRVASADWDAVGAELDGCGVALLPRLLTAAECGRIAAMYDDVDRFRSTVDMARYRFGRGQYRYFERPFPEPVQRLRDDLYPRLLPVARDWHGRLGRDADRRRTGYLGCGTIRM